MSRLQTVMLTMLGLVVARILIDPLLSSESRVLSKPIQRPSFTPTTNAATRNPYSQPITTQSYAYTDEYTEGSIFGTDGRWGATQGSWDPGFRKKQQELWEREQYIETKNEYDIPPHLVAKREAYHIKISAPLINPTNTRAIFHSAKPLCGVLGDAVAVVGNGPVHKEDEERIVQESSAVIRFNRISLKAAAMRTDVWTVRHNERPPLYYWGVNASWSGLDTVLNKTNMVVFMGGQPKHVANATLNVPQLKHVKSVHIVTQPYEDLYNKMYGIRRGVPTMPSTGLLGILMVLGCYKPTMKIHLWGFNWSKENYISHVMYVEAHLVKQLQKQYNIIIHDTACSAVRSCVSPSPALPRPMFVGGGMGGGGG